MTPICTNRAAGVDQVTDPPIPRAKPVLQLDYGDDIVYKDCQIHPSVMEASKPRHACSEAKTPMVGIHVIIGPVDGFTLFPSCYQVRYEGSRTA